MIKSITDIIINILIKRELHNKNICLNDDYLIILTMKLMQTQLKNHRYNQFCNVASNMA